MATLTQACTSENLHGVTRSETRGMNTSVSILRFYIRPEKHTKGFELSSILAIFLANAPPQSNCVNNVLQASAATSGTL